MLNIFYDAIQYDAGFHSQLRSRSVWKTGQGDMQDYMNCAVSPHLLGFSGERSGKLNLWHDCVDLGGVSIHYVEYDCDVDTVTTAFEVPASSMMVKYPLMGAARIQQADDSFIVRPKEFCVLRPGVPARVTMEGHDRHLMIALKEDWIERYLVSQNVYLRPRNLSFKFGALDINADGNFLSNVVASVVSSAARSEELARNHRSGAHMKDLITSFLLGLSPQYHLASVEAGGMEAIPHYIRRAEDFMRKNLTSPINLDEIVKASGRTRRTVHAGFRKYRGTTPLSFLKSLRLDAAKRELEASSLEHRAVTSVATHYGFYHLGKFSRDFKTAFGCLPSELLRK